jgi:hypothetical protein
LDKIHSAGFLTTADGSADTKIHKWSLAGRSSSGPKVLFLYAVIYQHVFDGPFSVSLGWQLSVRPFANQIIDIPEQYFGYRPNSTTI